MAFTIKANFDNTKLFERIGKGPKRLTYAVVNTLNLTTSKVQEHLRKIPKQKFTVRRDPFIRREIAVRSGNKSGGGGFASVKQNRFFTEIHIGQKERLLLSSYEGGAPRTPFTGKHVSLPFIGGPARRTFASKVPPSLHHSKLKFRRADKGPLLVNEKYYIRPGVGLFKKPTATAIRKGKKSGSAVRGQPIHMFWRSGDPKIRLRPVLKYYKVAEAAYNRYFPEFWQKEKLNAITRGGLI